MICLEDYTQTVSGWGGFNARPHEDYTQTVPGWCGFNALLRTKELIPLPHKVGYLPVIDISPTDLNVIYTLMKRFMDIIDINSGCHVDQPRHSVVVVCDQAVYANAFEIYNSPLHDRLEIIVLRLGALHIIIHFMAIIGSRFGSAGLRDVLIESDI